MTDATALRLDGLRVLVTRPHEQAASLSARIEAAGGEAIRFPLLEILPGDSAEDANAVLSVAGDFDWIIFVSANAVRYALQFGLHIERRENGAPRIAAIGEATAAALQEAGLSVDLLPKPQFNSESLLAAPEFADVAGQDMLIVRGEGGRELVADVLSERGATVRHAAVYRRGTPTDVDGLLPARLQAGAVDAILITSGDALENLMRLTDDSDRSALMGIPLIVVSARIRDLAAGLGFHDILVADNASDEALLDSLTTLATPSRETNQTNENGDRALVDENKDFTPTGIETAAEEIAFESPADAPKRSKIGVWLGYGTLLIIILLVGAGVFLLQELRSKQEGLGGELKQGDQQMIELTRQISGLQSEQTALHNQFVALQSELSTEDSKFERELGEHTAALSERFDNSLNSLQASIQNIQRQLNRTRGDVMIADAEYLLSIANQKLHLVGDIKAVLAAMEAADQRLHDSGDPAVFKVREALAAEIDALKEFDAPDVVGISAKMLTIEAGIGELPLFLPHSEAGRPHVEEQAAHPDEHQETRTGNPFIDSTLEEFRDLVHIRRSDKPIKAILKPEEVAIIRQTLLLRLEAARASLLRGDENLYRSSLDAVLSWLKEHFDGETEQVRDTVETIQTLQNVAIRVPYPDIGKSLNLLRNIEKLRVEAEKLPESTKPPVKQLPAATAQPAPIPAAPTEAVPATPQEATGESTPAESGAKP